MYDKNVNEIILYQGGNENGKCWTEKWIKSQSPTTR